MAPMDKHDQSSFTKPQDDLHSLTYLRITDTLLTPRELTRFRLELML